MSAAAGPWVRAFAPAKVNPFLEVVARRPDGFHDVDTTLLALELADEVRVRTTASGALALCVEGPFASADVPRDARNLGCAAAAAALEHARARGAVPASTGLELALVKRVPSQAGLGGGSSDAAACLAAAERALGLELEPERAQAVLAALGSDCVFFREARASGFARCTGRGERVEPRAAPGRDWTLIVATPACGAPTAQVYGALSAPLRNGAPARSLRPDALELDLPSARASLFNRLEEAALAAVPELRAWRTVLDGSGAAHFRLSGSGSSFFGLYDDAREAEAARSGLLEACARHGLAARGVWCTRPARCGARVLAPGP